MNIGLDIGSTTIKCVVFDEQNNIIYKTYERHFAHITKKATELLQRIETEFAKGEAVKIAISGSAGMGLANACNVPFVQEVYATNIATKAYVPNADVVIELGGEDAKILFLTNGTEVRMNGSCAGGTGAFIDQMATLLKIAPDEMNELAKNSQKTYTIASRCGVFAKSDIQPLINQSASIEDISSSIFGAVVNQTIAGLAQGRSISGNIVYLGGPLTFFSQLRKSFDKALGLNGICPKNSLYFVAAGSALCAEENLYLNEIIDKLKQYKGEGVTNSTNALFNSEKDYEEFCQRHAKAAVKRKNYGEHIGNLHLGIDAGSTTLKIAVIDDASNLIYTKYRTNSGSPITALREILLELYEECKDISFKSATATGYGEEMMKCAFKIDEGVVETIAHFTAARFFMPEVDFVIDIGGQDMKCFKIESGIITDIFLNEACSSGCGSFLQTFAHALGQTTKDFAKIGLFAKNPVALGNRCTVFMNSSVKQAQKDGASIESISAGLATSVVKNALYKVIRASSPDDLGKNIVVQGGTFYNDAVLRSFEVEMGTKVIRPDISGVMGAFGAALYGKENAKCQKSTILNKTELLAFTHSVKHTTCGLCTNNCKLNVNTFSGGTKYISGNKCEKPTTKKAVDNSLNLYEYKRELLNACETARGKRGIIGIPLVLNMYEMLPFWHAFFTSLGYGVVHSGFSDRDLYINGQSGIPSDTVCFPAKLVHGHINRLNNMALSAIFYPCMTYNFDENKGDNHYNCPVVAYYPEVIAASGAHDGDAKMLYPYLGVHRQKDFVKKIHKILKENLYEFSAKEINLATEQAFKAHEEYFAKIQMRGMQIISKARAENKRILVLAGRPYHVDPEINHGIDKLICSYNAAVITEDSIAHLSEKFDTSILNQWTYHARLYCAAKYVATQEDIEFVQLVSFGCGLDAITTDEVREILQQSGKLCTQIKIDEITNLGTVGIRLRSLFAAIAARK